jgi:hypothetical protein
MKLNDTFDHIYCINLNNRLDRWENCIEEFSKYGVAVERFSASTSNDIAEPYTVNSGEAGLILTHKRIFQNAIDHGYSSILILEDDVEFAENFEEYLEQIPEDWDVIFLGGNHLRGIGDYVNGRIYRAYQTYACHAVGFNSKQFTYLKDNIGYELPVDVTYANILDNMNSYVFKPVLAWQRPGWSDLLNSYTNYTFLRD